MHGLRPGPQLFETDLHITYAFLIALLIGNIFIILIGVLVVTRLPSSP